MALFISIAFVTICLAISHINSMIKKNIFFNISEYSNLSSELIQIYIYFLNLNYVCHNISTIDLINTMIEGNICSDISKYNNLSSELV